jgi:hypothetical protein
VTIRFHAGFLLSSCAGVQQRGLTCWEPRSAGPAGLYCVSSYRAAGQQLSAKILTWRSAALRTRPVPAFRGELSRGASLPPTTRRARPSLPVSHAYRETRQAIQGGSRRAGRPAEPPVSERESQPSLACGYTPPTRPRRSRAVPRAGRPSTRLERATVPRRPRWPQWRPGTLQDDLAFAPASLCVPETLWNESERTG